jgi:uncharacterized membrane protein YidH (DUF202 family)
MTATFNTGLQRERTAMAWNRTGLAMLVNALLVLRAGALAGQPLVVALGFLLLVASGGAVGCGAWRAHHLARGAEHTTPLLLIVASVAGVWVACAAGVAAVLVTVH